MGYRAALPASGLTSVRRPTGQIGISWHSNDHPTKSPRAFDHLQELVALATLVTGETEQLGGPYKTAPRSGLAPAPSSPGGVESGGPAWGGTVSGLAGWSTWPTPARQMTTSYAPSNTSTAKNDHPGATSSKTPPTSAPAACIARRWWTTHATVASPPGRRLTVPVKASKTCAVLARSARAQW